MRKNRIEFLQINLMHKFIQVNMKIKAILLKPVKHPKEFQALQIILTKFLLLRTLSMLLLGVQERKL